MNIFQEIFDKHYNKDSDLVIGIGTGKTINSFISKVNFPENKIFIPTSLQTSEKLKSKNLEIKNLNEIKDIKIYFDSADYIDQKNNLIKGGGGAFLKEKKCMKKSKKNIIILSKNKFVKNFENLLIPFEIEKEYSEEIKSYLANKKLKFEIRKNEFNENFVTENENFIFDIEFNEFFLKESESIKGIVENGYFLSSEFDIFVERI